MAKEERLKVVTRLMASVFIEELGKEGGLLQQDDAVMAAGIERLIERSIRMAVEGGAA